MKRALWTAIAILGVSVLALSAPVHAQQTTQVTQADGLTIDSAMGDLLANPAARAILEERSR